ACRHFSPPRMPVNQSCTRTTRGPPCPFIPVPLRCQPAARAAGVYPKAEAAGKATRLLLPSPPGGRGVGGDGEGCAWVRAQGNPKSPSPPAPLPQGARGGRNALGGGKGLNRTPAPADLMRGSRRIRPGAAPGQPWPRRQNQSDTPLVPEKT